MMTETMEGTEATGSQTEQRSNGDKKNSIVRFLRFAVPLFVITVTSVVSVPAPASAQTQQPVIAAARILKRMTVGGVTIDGDAELGRTTQHSYVDYVWIGELNVLARRPITERVGVFAHGTGQFFTVDDTVPNRGAQAGGLVEAGVRINGKGGALELFIGYEKRVDADPFDRQSEHWGLAGFRILS